MKIPVKNIALKALALLGLGLGGIMLAGAVKTKDAKPCGKVEVHYSDHESEGFLPQSEVLAIIEKSVGNKAVGKPLREFNLNAIELELEHHPWIRDAQLFFDNTQTLHVVLVEAIPVARCLDINGNQFYLDNTGLALPISKQFRANVPVFTHVPNLNKNLADSTLITRIIHLATAIVKDSFWNAQAAQIDVLPSGYFEMVPAIGNHIVELGNGSLPEEMLNRLKVFYSAMAANGRLDDYQVLNASFSKQIVAKSHEKPSEFINKKEAMLNFQQMVSTNKSTVNANSEVVENKAGSIIPETPVKNRETNANEVKRETVNYKKQGMQTDTKNNKVPEKELPKKEEKVPKAIMPKLEEN